MISLTSSNAGNNDRIAAGDRKIDNPQAEVAEVEAAAKAAAIEQRFLVVIRSR